MDKVEADKTPLELLLVELLEEADELTSYGDSKEKQKGYGIKYAIERITETLK